MMRAKVEAANDALTRFLMPGGERSTERLDFAVQMLQEAIAEDAVRRDLDMKAMAMAHRSAGGTI